MVHDSSTDGTSGSPAQVQSGNRILFVDDEEMITEMAKEVLEGKGYRVSVFNDSKKALEAFRVSPHGFDLILVDHSMPAMSGTELALECRTLHPTIPIVMATGFAQGIEEQLIEDGIFASILEKPYRLNVLGDKIREALDQASK